MRALIVEDDKPQRDALCGTLREWGYTPTSANDGASGLLNWQDCLPDVVLLDLGLPDMDGLEVLQIARRQGLSAPVLLITARATLGDRVLGLNLGADDYLVKPFDFSELQARLQALMRRVLPGARLPARLCKLGAMTWDPAGAEFLVDGQALYLTPRERSLLLALAERPNRAYPREALMEAVFPRGLVRAEALEVVAHRLRKKLVPCGVSVVTLRGLGYLIKAA